MYVGVKWPKREADLSSPYSAKVTKPLSTTPVHDLVLRQSEKQTLFCKNNWANLVPVELTDAVHKAASWCSRNYHKLDSIAPRLSKWSVVTLSLALACLVAITRATARWNRIHRTCLWAIVTPSVRLRTELSCSLCFAFHFFHICHCV